MSVISARSFWLPVLMTTLVAALFGAMLERGGRDYRGLLLEQARLEDQLAQLSEENRRLQIERYELFSQLSAVERAAREELGLIAPGESVLRVEPRPKAAPAEAVPVLDESKLSPVQRWLTSPDLAGRMVLGALALSAAVFLIWNVAVAAWRYGAPADAGVEAAESPEDAADAGEHDTDRRQAA